MKHVAVLMIFALAALCVPAQSINVVPLPKSVSKTDGGFRLTYKTKIVATDETGRKTAGILNELLLKAYGFKLEYTEKPQKKNAIVVVAQGFPVKEMPAESYGLTITKKGVQILGSETGQFYALQTLLQLIPSDFKGSAELPGVDISDAPRFGYRGMHLDVSRHFMPLEFVKKYVDLMSMYKFNQFHWHLTDDQGWRIEIKKYPRLTEVASKRPETMFEKNFNPYKGDGVPVEGFYTQDQIRELVAYARARHINVIPEIELPGHSSAALAAYPELGCKTDLAYKVQTTWGIFKEVYCPTETTFRFLEDVVDETMALFPDSPYVHIGGDEVLKDHWKESPFVQELKAREGLKDEHEVQSYIVRRIERHINEKGRNIIGWDEILEGGLAPNAVVMSWRGEKGGIEAAKAKHKVIMTPSSNLYFDFGQGDAKNEPINIGNYLPLETVYAYNPIPKELSEEDAKYVLGAQANLWTEYIKTPSKVEYMVFPRMLALAEVDWTPLERKNFEDFESRLATQYARLDKLGVNYRIPEPKGLRNVIVDGDAPVGIELSPKVPGAKIYYTTDGSEPTPRSALYSKPLGFSLKPSERVDLRAIVVTGGGRASVPYGATLLRSAMLPAVEPTGQNQGAKARFYAGAFDGIGALETATPTAELTTKTLALGQFGDRTNKLRDPFGVSFDGFVKVSEDGIYEIQLDANDAGRVTIDGQTVVEIAAPAGDAAQTKFGIVPLAKGFHRIGLAYLQKGGDSVFSVRLGVKGTGLRRLGGAELSY